ncbi:putative GTPase binding protein rid1 [Rosellinia necatrix]|uniref:Putative GTPase binding protein rid1 n=1 Tax=Rosellinia necatrix TaxID=77044 RepID=A0A1W2TG22_ROSNE|nr:putative GTPase binding protein rid1 [Rosellinia necatrix]
MASVNHDASVAGARPPRQHNRSRSNVLASFMNRRNDPDGPSPTPAGPRPLSIAIPQTFPKHDMVSPALSRPAALGEIQNQAESSYRSPTKSEGRSDAPRSPTKHGFIPAAFKSTSKTAKNKEDPLTEDRPKKTKSATNLVALLKRPKSQKNLQKPENEEDIYKRREKENLTPPASVTPQEISRPPIYAQFSSGALERQNEMVESNDNFSTASTRGKSSNSPAKERPKSYHVQHSAKQDSQQTTVASNGSSKSSSPSKIQRGLKILTSGTGSRNKPPPTPSLEFVLDPKNIDTHLEAMLDRRNIPEHQRYKMRNLTDTIKMEFIRQDWAESKGINATRPGSHDSDRSMTGSQDKRSRGRSFTLSRNSGKKSESRSPTKKSKGEGTLGRHFRTRSTESFASERPSSSGSGAGSSILSKMKLQQGPLDYVNYLRKVQRPELVEVGKLHKLRLLLRNETVAWTEEFIRQGGMQEIVGLLHRIMEVEWREEHEDALLHENLLCLKALCTTALAVQYLHSIQATLFPALLHMLFDPEKKGPSEFTTRNIVISVLFTYIQSALPQDRHIRAKTVLGHLRDPAPKEENLPLGFVLEMQRERPYRVWCKETTNVTKEVFWIFLHHLNIVYLPRDKEPKAGSGPTGMDSMTYMRTYFPQERTPVAAAPYVGGVEWDATNYLATHLDLLNAVIACTPTAEERNTLRGLLAISGWERCMGASLRLCKEKFYPGVHDGLRTWVAAAAEDGWDMRNVRYGPPPEAKSPTKSKAKKDDQPAPKIEMPNLSFGFDGLNNPASPAAKLSENWLS